MHPSKDTTLYLIRHGETIWNRELRFQGHRDSPLTEKGRRQARALGRRMRQMAFDELYASDLGRALETAGIIAGLTSHEVIPDERLRERNYGVLEGLTEPEIRVRHPDVLDLLRDRNPEYVIPEGESHRRQYQRNIAFLEEMAGHKAGKRIAAVSHGGVLDSCFRHICGLDLAQVRCFTTANTGLAVLLYKNVAGMQRWLIQTWGDVGHLESHTAL